jgi:hypothetical protein
MRIISCGDDSDNIKNFFKSIKNQSTPQLHKPRIFGAAFTSSTYAIPVSTSHTTPQFNTNKDINIISGAESAVDQAKSELDQDEKIDTLVPQGITDLALSKSAHSHSRKRKRQQPNKSPSKKVKVHISSPSTSKKHKNLKQIF